MMSGYTCFFFFLMCSGKLFPLDDFWELMYYKISIIAGDSLTKAEEATLTAKKKFNDENEELNELLS